MSHEFDKYPLSLNKWFDILMIFNAAIGIVIMPFSF